MSIRPRFLLFFSLIVIVGSMLAACDNRPVYPLDPDDVDDAGGAGDAGNEAG